MQLFENDITLLANYILGVPKVQTKVQALKIQLHFYLIHCYRY